MTTETPKHSVTDTTVESDQVKKPEEAVPQHVAKERAEAEETDAPQHAEETKEEHTTGGHANAAHATARRRRWLRIVLVVVGAIVVLCLVFAAALGWFVNSGKDELLADNQTDSLRQTIARDGTSYVFNEDMVTVALIGTDRMYGNSSGLSDEVGQADAIMLMAYDTSTGKITLINVPRNTYTRFSYPTSYGGEGSVETFLSAAYAYGKTDAESAEIVCGAVSDLLNGLPVENYVVLLESCIDPLTEAMGGVTLTAIEDVRGGIKEGETYTLTGEQALYYVQYRNTWLVDSPTKRMNRQHEFADAFLHQSIAAIKKDPSIIGKFYDIITDPDYMITNLDLNELAYLASAVITNGVGNLEMVTLPYEIDYDPESHLEAYLPDRAGIMDLLLDVYYKPAEQ